MYDERSLSHTKRECKYHLRWIPKYRKKELYGDLRKYLGEVFRELARRRECEILEGHLMPDHAHMLISIFFQCYPPFPTWTLLFWTFFVAQ